MNPTVTEVPLLPGVGAWFTGRPDAPAARVGAPGNLSHRRPHLPAELAAARRSVCARMGVPPDALHLMRQVHGARVGVVSARVPPGTELREVDALATAESGRPLAVQVADCVPLLLASDAGPVAAVHVGRRGLRAGIVGAALEALRRLGAPAGSLHAAIGPAIGGCCYEVPRELQEDVLSAHPAAAATTTWGTPSLDLPRAVAARLARAGVARVLPPPGCTRCDPSRRWFSHRRDRHAGRQLGVIVRTRAVGEAAA